MTSLLFLAILWPLVENTTGPTDVVVRLLDPCGPRTSAAVRVYHVQAGDLILYRQRNLAQNALYALFRSAGATHVGIVVHRPDGSLGLLEAIGPGRPVVISDIPSRLAYFNGPVWVRPRHHPLTTAQDGQLTAFACASEGKRFDLFGIFGPAWSDPVHHRPGHCLDDADLNAKRWYCSSLVVGAGVATGLFDPCLVRPRHTAPQDFMTDCPLDLRACGWGPPVPWLPDGPRLRHWWSESSSGEVHVWPDDRYRWRR